MAKEEKQEEMCDYECGDIGDLCEEVCDPDAKPEGLTEYTDTQYHSIWSDKKNLIHEEVDK